ncbi:MAG TPA: protein translocase subunit SecD [Terriglobales bacterium]|nr:protein translocase subunit SecD [Terriglobales bacterium]
MKRILLYKSLFIVVVVLGCLMAITGIPKGLSWQAWKTSILSNIHLGLDLQGGTHLILQVHAGEAVAAETAQAEQRLQADLTSKGIAFSSILQPDPKGHPELISVRGLNPTRVGDFRTAVQDDLGPNYDIRAVSSGNFDLTLNPTAVQSVKDHALTQSIETISNRVNQLGVTEPTVQAHGLGAYQILVQLPGITDPDRVKQVMQETAQLQFRLGKAGPFPSESAARAQYGGVLPEDSEVLPGQNIGGASTSTTGTDWYVVSRTAVVSGSDLRDAQPQTDNNGQMEVSFTLTRDAGQRFGAFTEANINRPLAIVLDNQVQEYATIQSRIEDQGRITGSFSNQQASDLALVLRSGALPASITYLQDEEVGPSLGADSIHQGVMAAITGFLLVAGFMLFYYHGAGINAVLALVLNLVILMAYMSVVSATLTLPGIAGIILTIGMAVDSNVLIFERIREEMRHGKSVPAAVDIGFRQAFITILDTHVTTVVSAIFLFLFGTGPIKGFAVTLTAGLIANLFTAVYISRVIFDYVLLRQQGVRGAKLSIG